MICSQVPKSKVLSSYSLESLQTASKNHVKALDKQFGSLSKPEVSKPSVSSHKSILEHRKTGPLRRMVQYVAMRKRQRNTKGGVFPKKPLREHFLVTEIDIEKARKEEDFVLKIHDLVMLSEMTTEGTEEKNSLLKQIEALRMEYEKALQDLDDISDPLRTQQLGTQCLPSTSDCPLTTNGFPVHTNNLHRNFPQSPHFTSIVSSGTHRDHDLVDKNQIVISSDNESLPCLRNNMDFDTLDTLSFDESRSQVESKELEELRTIISLLIAQREALRTDFEGFCGLVSDLVDNSESLIVADQKLSALEASKDALFREQQILLNDINNEWNEHQKFLESRIESQVRGVEGVHSELTDMKRESEESNERAKLLSNEVQELSRRYHENLNSIKALQREIQEEEARSASLLFVKDFEYENMLEVHHAELIKLKNEISVISFENILFSSKIAEVSADLQYSEKMASELNVNVNALVSLIDQIRTHNDALTSEVGRLSDFSTSHQRSAFSEKLDLLHELNNARSTIFLLQSENTSLSLERNEFYDKRHQSDTQEETAMLRGLVEKIEAEKDELRRKYLALFEKVVHFNAQNTCQIEMLMEKTSCHA